MKIQKLRYITYALAAMYAAAMVSCSTADKNESHSDHDHDHEQNHKTEENDKHDHADGEIVLEPEDAARYGVQTAIVELIPFSDSRQVTGQIVNSSSSEAIVTATTAGIVKLNANAVAGSQVKAGSSLGSISASNISGGDPNHAARVAIESAKKAVDRLKPLYDEGIATRAEYEEAVARLNAAKAAYSPVAASGALTSPISGTVSSMLVQQGQYVEAGTPIAIISNGNELRLRADLPEKDRDFMHQIENALVRPTYSDQWIDIKTLKGHLINNVVADIQTVSGYLPVYFSLDSNGELNRGGYVDVVLVSRNSSPAIVIPKEAIVEQQGVSFVYVKTGDHAYQKRKVEIGSQSGDQYRIESGLNEGDEVVVKNAVVVKLAESSGNIPEGHSHNH